MPYSALTITRDDIDGYEGVTFDDYNSATTLKMGDRDSFVLDKAKKELKADILDNTGQFWRDGDYANETALLDALYDADSEGQLKDLLTLKFLSLWFFQDAQSEEALSYSKARSYHHKYVRYLSINLGRITSNLATPRSAPRYRFQSAYG